ncbi:hypothetical protein PT2222_70367 [Paraburkholderia tropica]
MTRAQPLAAVCSCLQARTRFRGSGEQGVLGHDLARNELEFVEGIGDLLLLRDHFCIDRLVDVRVVLEAALDDRGVEPLDRRKLCGRRGRIGANPLARFAEFVEGDRNRVLALLREFALTQEELMMLGDAVRVGDETGAVLRLHRREERVPHCPRVDRTALQRGARIGGREVDGLDIAQRDAVLLQQRDEEPVHVRSLVQGDFLALEFGNGLDRRLLADHQTFGVGRRHFVGGVDKVRAGGLRENRRRFAHVTEIDRADVQAFEQLRPRRELVPRQLDAERREALFERAVRLEQHQRARGLLIADAELIGLKFGPGGQRGACERGAQRGEYGTAAVESGGHVLRSIVKSGRCKMYRFGRVPRRNLLR